MFGDEIEELMGFKGCGIRGRGPFEIPVRDNACKLAFFQNDKARDVVFLQKLATSSIESSGIYRNHLWAHPILDE